jgi:hypothetical protein
MLRSRAFYLIMSWLSLGEPLVHARHQIKSHASVTIQDACSGEGRCAPLFYPLVKGFVRYSQPFAPAHHLRTLLRAHDAPAGVAASHA